MTISDQQMRSVWMTVSRLVRDGELATSARIAQETGLSMSQTHRVIRAMKTPGGSCVLTRYGHGYIADPPMYSMGDAMLERRVTDEPPPGRDERDEFAIRLGLALTAIRDARGMTREDVYYASGVSKSYLSLLESGLRIAQLSKLEQIANVLGVPLFVLLIMAEDPGMVPDELRDAADNLVGKLTGKEWIVRPPTNFVRVVDRRRYDTSKSVLLASDAYWDGHNFERFGRNKFLYRTSSGRYFIVTLSQWQGERDELLPLSPHDAVTLYERELPEHYVDYSDAFPSITIEDA